MQCYVYGKEVDSACLCREHCYELKEMSNRKKNIINNPSFANHCLICGEFHEKTIVEYPAAGYICKECIEKDFDIGGDEHDKFR